jgi:uncharacterized HhH-GPD family protein
MADDQLHFTPSQEANRLLVDEPMALLIGFALDQQVPLTRAFASPLELKRRLGHLDPAKIAAMDPDELDVVFREKPALHRFPGSMAKRTGELCQVVVDDYNGDAARVWTEASSGEELRDRIAALPGFGKMKIASLLAVLGKRLDVAPTGMADVMPTHPTIGDVDSMATLESYQAHKREMKAAARAKRGA